uniref:RING-type E3 ubiquitin transferase n=1 Tax=Rhizophora mucronata TaxID=61149 RepID=A0A2P2J8S2_RHIMU
MIQKFHCSDRRILTFPAVHPCESIAPETLLSSLITASQTICNYQSEFFATHRRNARETIRQIGILVIFLEELRDRKLLLSDSTILCLSELHLACQKIQFLIEDCTRAGAKLWMLMKSQRVANQFRVLIRSIATALDVLPLNLIDVCVEVKEFVEMVAKQARKTKFEIDPEDEWASKQVRLILDHFEKGIEPESSLIKRVFDNLEIRSWSGCNEEIKFLEEEIDIHCSDRDEREVPFLSSLLGLANYCRGVLFETLDYRNNDRSYARCSSTETLSCLNPEDFRCPISLELMTDPVTVSTGQTYDRSSIQKWLNAGNMICPKTGERLTSTDLVPNASLHKVIQQFCADRGVSLSKSGRASHDLMRTVVPGSPAAAEATKFLSRHLTRRLIFGSTEQKKKAAQEIRLFAKSNIFNRSCLIEAGAIPPLLNLLSSPDRSTQEKAIAALLKLSKHASGKKVIIESGGVRSIIAVLKMGSSLEARQLAAATIFYLASVKGYRKLIGETSEAVPALVELIKNGTSCGKKNAMVAIFGLLLYPGNHRRVLASGIIPLLADIPSSADKEEFLADSLAILATLAESAEGTFEILQNLPIPSITRILQSLPSKSGKEYCVSILLSLCENGGVTVIEALAKDTSLMSSLYSLITDGTSHARSKARTLIDILHKLRETSSSGLVASAVQCERPLYIRNAHSRFLLN